MQKPFKALFVRRFEEFVKEYPEYSLGEILYSLMRRECLPTKPKDVNTSWLLGIGDRELYGAIEYAKDIEKDDKIRN